jgi:tetratricopeptide (TPR) repeat protein
MVLNYRGLCALESKAYEAARQFFSQQVEVAERVNDVRQLFFALYNLGITEIELEQYTHALTILQRGHQIALDANNHHWVAFALSGMARVFHGLGQRETAQKHLNQALPLYQKFGDTTRVNWVLAFIEKEHYDLEPESIGA